MENPDSITITRGFVIQAVITIATIIGSFFYLQADVKKAVTQGEQNATDIRVQGEAINGMRMDLRSIRENVEYFRQTYEKDMRTYVREPGKK